MTSPILTDSLQVFDRAVSGAMKAAARRMSRMDTAHTDRPRLPTLEAAQFLTRA
jgi:hypothetical protein